MVWSNPMTFRVGFALGAMTATAFVVAGSLVGHLLFDRFVPPPANKEL